MSGAGKTVLAADEEVGYRFRGGVVWLRLAPGGPPRQGLDRMLTELGRQGQLPQPQASNPRSQNVEVVGGG